MFDHLDTLDDATPPAPDDAMLTNVHRRVDRSRRRTRLTFTATAITALVILVGVVVATGDQKRSVSVITPSSTSVSTPATLPATTPPYHPVYSVAGTLPNGLSVRMNLGTESVQLGDDIHVNAVVTNNTDKTQIIGESAIQCVVGVGLVCRDERGNVVADGRQNVGCDDIGRSLARNQTVTVSASLPTESVRLASGARQGRFELRLEDERAPGSDPPVAGSIGPLRIFVYFPKIDGRLIVPAATAHPGSEIKGTLEIDTYTSAVHAGCATSPPYDVFVAVGGVALEPGRALGAQKCTAGPFVLPPGVTRVPFSLYAQYYDCSSAGNTSADTPRCINGPNHQPTIPPLPPGRYEIRFRGIGPLAGLAISPVAITVVADGAAAANEGLPKISGATAALARDQFRHLYYDRGSYVAALAARGVAVTGLYESGSRLVIQIPPGPGIEAARTLIRSLFDHPDLVDVHAVAVMPQ